MALSKKITSLIISLLIIASTLSVASLAENADETYTVMDSTTMANLAKNDTYSSISQDVTRLSDKTLKLSGDGTSSGSTSSESKRWKFASAKDWTGYNYINLLAKNDAETTSATLLCLCVEGVELSGSKGYWNKRITIPGNSWRVVSVPLSEFGQAYTGTKTEGDKYSEMNTITGLVFDGINGEFYVDSIWVSQSQPTSTQCIKTSVPNGYDDVSAGEKIFSFTYNNNLADISVQNGSAVFAGGENGEQSIDCRIEYGADEAYVIAEEDLDYNTKYTITLNGIWDTFGADAADVSLIFTTGERAVSVSCPTLADEEGNPITELPQSGIVTSSAKVFNPTDSAEQITLVLALYDSDGKLLTDGSAFETVTVEPEQEDAYVTAQIEYDDYSGMSVCAFVIDSEDKRNLISAQYARLPEVPTDEPTEATDGAANELTLTTFDYANDTAVMEASLNGGMKRTLLVSVLSDDGIIHMSPLHNTADGKVSASYAMTNDNSTGDYTMEISGRKVNGKISEKFYHLNETDKQTVFDTANSLTDSDDALKLLSDYADVFQFTEEEAANITLMLMTAESLVYNMPYEDFENAKSFVKNASAVCAELNSQSWDTLADFIIANENILIGNSDIEYFKNLSSTNRNKTCRYIDSFEFESLEDLYNKLSDAVDEYKDSLVSNSGGSGGGSGSSRPSSSGGGGYSVQTPSVIVPPADIPTVSPETNSEPYSFGDLAGFDWAEKSINALAANGVISKPDNKNFRPADMITRAEFVKLLVCAMYNSAEIASSEFTDIDKNDWSYPYISIAHHYGLINGREDGSFGKNDCITRQEMAAVIHRALVHKNVSLASGLSEFAYSDDSSISDYAKTAVYALYHSGIMSGMGDGSFAADANANRAQAACVIDRLQKGVHNE